MKLRKTALCLLLAAVLLAALLSGCGAKKAGTDASEDFAGQKIGVVTGTVHEDIAREHFPKAELYSYNNYTDLAEALDKGKIDAYILDKPAARLLAQAYPGQCVSPVLEPASYAYAFAKGSEQSDRLREQLDAFIAESRENGMMQELDELWLGTDEECKTVGIDRLTGENGTLHFAVSTDAGEPFIYLKDEKLVGYEIDIIVRFCEKYGYDLEMTNYSFASLLAAVAGGKADLAASTIAITEERKESMNFSIPDYEGGVVMMTKTAGNTENTRTESTGEKLGVVINTTYEDAARRLYPDKEICFYNNTVDLAKALDKGEIDAYLLDEPVGRLVVKPYSDQRISEILEPASFAFAFPKDSEFGDVLRGQMDAFIEKSRQNGVLQEIKDVWLGDDESKKTVSFDRLTGENGTIRLAISADIGEPFVYFKNGGLVGYEVDLLARFCAEYGYDLNITSYTFSALFSALSEGMNDIAACAITVTEEREELVNFSLPTYESGIVIVTRVSGTGEQTRETEEGFWASLRESFGRTFLRENRWKLFLSGLGITFLITMVSMLLGTLGGFAVYLLIRRGSRVFNGIWAFFASVMGRTPVVVILMILYYVVFGRSDLGSVGVSIIGFTAMFSCTVAELLKMGAGAVNKGQTEAALAMGYSEGQTYLRIIFPQSVEHFLPAYKSEVVTLVKATAIVGYIAVQDLTKVSDLVRGRTYEAFFPLIATAVIYYLLTLLLTWLIQRIDIITDPRRRDEKQILRGIRTR